MDSMILEWSLVRGVLSQTFASLPAPCDLGEGVMQVEYSGRLEGVL
jgi:hypothetical protein